MSAPDRSNKKAAAGAAKGASPAAGMSNAAGDQAAVTQKVAPKKAAAKKTAPRKPAKPASAPRHAESRLTQVLVAPIVSEKATLVSEKRNQVTFEVLRDATKPEIKAAVELMFKVEVASVQTLVHKGRFKKFGRSMGRRDHVKKAYVALKPGQELNFSGEGA